MSKVIYVNRCVECPLFLILFRGDDEDEIYRCERTDYEIPKDVSDEHRPFPAWCPLGEEK